MYRYFTAALLLIVSLTAKGQIEWQTTKGPYGGTIREVIVNTTTSTVYALSDVGFIFRSTDGGDNWARMTPSAMIPSGDDSQVRDVDITNDGTLWLLTYGNIYKSIDDGVTVTKVNTGANSSSGGFESATNFHKNVSSGTLYISGYHSTDNKTTLFKSTNGGAIWTKGAQNLDFTTIVSTNTGDVYAVTSSNVLYKSNTDGSSFNQQTSPTDLNQTISLASRRDGSQLAVVTNLPGIYTLSSPFASWTSVATTGITAGSFTSEAKLAYTPDNSILMLADNERGAFYTRTNAGSWVQKTSTFPTSDRDMVRSITAKDNSNLYVGAQKLGVSKSINGGTGWIPATDGVTALGQISSMVIADNGSVLIGGDKPYISTDKGNTWSVPFTSTNPYSRYQVFKALTGGQIAMLCDQTPTPGSVSYKSTTNGNSWTTIPQAPAGRFATADGMKILSYDDGTLYFSQNQGTTWSPGISKSSITGLPAGTISINDVAMDNSTQPKVFVDLYDYTSGSAVRKLYRVTLNNNTTPTSATATNISLATVGINNINELAYYNNAIYVYGYNGTTYAIAISTDGGLTWPQKPLTFQPSNMFIDPTTGYIFMVDNASGGYTVYVSRDNGTNFDQTSIVIDPDRTNPVAVAVDPIQGYAYATFTNQVAYRTKATVILPSAPTALSSPAQSTDRVVLKWKDNSSNEDEFVIEALIGSNYQVLAIESDNDELSHATVMREITGLTPNTSYTFRISSRNGAGSSDYANVTASTSATCALSGIPDNRSWNGTVNATALTNIGVVYKGNGMYLITDIGGALLSGGTASRIFQEFCGKTLVLAEDDVFASGTGTYNTGTKQLVLNWIENDNTTVTGVVTLTPNATDPGPGAPTNVGASVFDPTKIQVTWSPSLFASSYSIERSTASNFGSIQQTFTTNFPATSFLDNTGLAAGTTYYYRVKAVNSTSTSGASATASTTFTTPIFTLSGTAIETPVGNNTAGTFWGDFNNDGYEDLIITRFDLFSGAKNTPLIYKNNGAAGGFTEVGSASGMEPSAYLAGSVADYDNDGKLDIFLASSAVQNYLYKGKGDMTFQKVTSPMDENTPNDPEDSDLSVTWADPNNDGLLDILISPQQTSGAILKYYSQTSPGNFVKQTTGDLGTMTTTGASNLWVDYNNDGKQDVFFVERAQAVPSKLYKNNGDGSLTKYSPGAFDAVSLEGYGAAWGDYNNDGFLDVFMSSSADSGLGNQLFKNNGDGSFTRLTLAPVTDTQSASFEQYACTWADINNDMFLDLIGVGIMGSNLMYINNNGTSFTKVVNEKLTDSKISDFAMATADYNRDGFIDIAMSSIDPETFQTTQPSSAYSFLFKNLGGSGGNWVEFRLVGTQSNRSAFGARVIVVAGGKTQIREIQSTSSFVSQNSAVAHFGLAGNTAITSVTIKWPSGIVQEVTVPAINTYNVVTENDDPLAPVFGDMSTMPATVNKSALAQSFTVPVTDNKAVTEATLFIKPISGTTFTEVSIPASAITATGLTASFTTGNFDGSGAQYYFKVKDHAGNEAISPATAPAQVYTTSVKYNGTDATIPASLIGTGGTTNSWKIIAVPFELGSSNGVQTVFNELAGTVKVDYRIVTYTESPAPAWQDYPDVFNTIDRGVGYMINIKSPVSIVIGDGLVAPSNTRSNLFKISLKKGWNMIGNPYLDAVNWSDVVAFNSINGAGTKLKKFNAGNYEDATSVAAYEGGFVNVEADVQISIPFAGQTSGSRIQAPGFGPNEWLVPITLKQGELKNTFGGVGMHSTASLSFDQFDDLNGPRWFDYLEMKFSHPEYNTKAFARDVVPVVDEYDWSFEVASNVTGVATMTWDNETYTIGQDLYLYDEDTQTPVNMKETSSYSFDANVSRSFKVYYGANALSKIKPAKVMLGLAVPNPTTNTATIGFSIPEVRGKMNIRLEMFDLTGRKVGVLANGEFDAGFYSAQWQPLDSNGDGMYIYRLFAGDEILGGKLILRK